MKQTNYKKSFNSLKGLFLTGLILLSSSLLGQTIYDAEFRPLNFGTSPILVNSSSTITSVNSIGAQILYDNVIKIGEDWIDCRVTNTNGTSTGTGVNSGFDGASNSNQFTTTNDERTTAQNLLSLAFTQSNATNHSFTFEFGFATTSSSTSTNNGITTTITTISNFNKVNLENVYLNVYDIDREQGNSGSDRNVARITNNSFTTLEYTGSKFTSSTPSGYYQFDRNSSNPGNESNLTDIFNNEWRVRFVLTNVNTFELVLGNSKSSTFSSFWLGFSQGPAFSGSTILVNPTLPIRLDLNGRADGISRNINYNTSNSLVNFDIGTNNVRQISTGTARRINPLRIKFDSRLILDGNDEKLVVNGSTNNLVSLGLGFNSSTPSSDNFTLNGTNYRYTISHNSTSNITTIDFALNVNNDLSSMTIAQTDTLLGSLRYNNTDQKGLAGNRNFEITATALAITGSDAYTTTPAFFTANILTALPVNIISFTGKATANGNQLNWTVAQEENFSHYEVLSSINGSTYNKVGEVYPENKSMDMKNYAFTDLSATADLVFYKLNLINEDGSSDFSNIVAINRNSVAPVITNVYPNPATTSLLVSLEGVDAEVSTITIQDLSGKIVYSTETSDVSTLLNINELNKGMYIVKVASQSGFVSVSRFIKN